MTTLKPKYDVTFIDDRGHWYVIHGVKYPSVTAILKIIGGSKTDALMAWAKNVSLEYISNELKGQIGKEVEINELFIDHIVKVGKTRPKFELEKAADFGTRAHDAIDKYILYKETPQEAELSLVFNNFLKWLEEHKFKIIAGDTTVGSPTYGFGGRLDAIAVDDKGNFIILDWKTSNHIVKDYALQVSAYAFAFSETYGVPLPKECYVVRFDKVKPIFEIAKLENVERTFKAFVAAKTLKEEMDLELFE
jgi:hypothetical protein